MKNIQNAIFGGPPLSSQEVHTFLQMLDIRLPARVTATGEQERGPKNAVTIALHPGLRYWFEPVSGQLNSPTICNSPEQVIRAIQQAILLHRRQELRDGKTSVISDLAEAQAFHLALSEVRNGKRSELLEQWLEILFQRHHTVLHEIRRRLVEFLAALTRGVQAPLGYPFYSAIRRIYETFRLRELAELFRNLCYELGQLIAGRSSVHIAGAERSNAVKKAFTFMEENFSSPLGLQEVADATHVNPSHLARLFRRETGRTIVEYLQSLRINHAQELLATSELPALEIAFESGFESIEHFYRVFRRLTGTTPKNYRLTKRT